MSKILITGGAGFIGSQLGYYLSKKGHDVIALDNLSYGYKDNLIFSGKQFVEFVNMDVRSDELKRVMKGIEYVFHFAGIAPLPDCQKDPYKAVDINVGGTANVLETARLCGVKRLVFSSTAAIYENNYDFPTKEGDNVSPFLIYSTSKLQAELLCNAFMRTYGLDIVILRFFNIYGPNQDFLRKHPPLIGYIIRELLSDQSPILHSDGRQKRDYVFIEDVNIINEIVMTHPNAVGQVFNVCSNISHSVSEIFSIISKYLKKENIKPIYMESNKFWERYPELFIKPFPLKEEIIVNEVNKYSLGDKNKSKEMLGWEAKISLSQGLKINVDYVLKNKMSEE